MIDPKDVVFCDTVEGVLAQLEILGFRHIELRYVFEGPEGGFYYADVWEKIHEPCADAHDAGHPCEDCDDPTRAYAKTPLPALKEAARKALRLRAGRKERNT